MIETIVVCGAGTMGSGIAEVMAGAGFFTVLFDAREAALEKARTALGERLEAALAKGRMTKEEAAAMASRIRYTTDLQTCIGDLVIEAIVEDSAAKIALFNQLAEINHSDAIFATNTSSLSVSTIAAGVQHPERVCGLHFFNPAPVMKLVEVVRGRQTRSDVIETVKALAEQCGKTAVVCMDAPGFIVNRVARHFYLESLYLTEKGACSPETADALLTSAGFKMGPFRLMDLIGNDVNYAVTTSLYEAFGRTVRFKPSALQREKVEAGELGRKTGKGFYTY